MVKTKTPKKRAKKRSALDKAIDDVISSDLTERQKLFCLLYTTDAQCFGNASRSYIVAYDLKTPKERKPARQLGWRLLTNDYIIAYRDKLLKAAFTNTGVDKSLSEIIAQKKDMHASLGAIREYNKLKNRVKETPPNIGPITIKIAPEIAEKMKL